ncbi:MAG: hypothetical protein IPJ85_15555 [Flavobacteriales bacterium]|nr:hypothetical protein [Flavobacteriales bacterium]
MRPVLLLAATALIGCGRVADGTRSALNKGGEIAGSAATEVIEGVTTGVEKSWSIDVALSDDLKARGLSLGKTVVEEDSAGRDNRLMLYLIAEQDFTGAIMAIAKDQDGREFGRASSEIRMLAGTADFHLLRFQPLTDLERKSRIELR